MGIKGMKKYNYNTVKKAVAYIKIKDGKLVRIGKKIVIRNVHISSVAAFSYIYKPVRIVGMKCILGLLLQMFNTVCNLFTLTQHNNPDSINHDLQVYQQRYVFHIQ